MDKDAPIKQKYVRSNKTEFTAPLCCGKSCKIDILKNNPLKIERQIHSK